MFARTFDENEMRDVTTHGAEDYVTHAEKARLLPAVERELRRRVSSPEPEGPRRDAPPGLLQAVVDELPFVLFVKEAERLSLVLVNRAIEQMFGVTRGSLIGTVDQVAEQVNELKAAGSERIYFQLVPVNDHGMLEIIANDLAPKCK